tara:strand:- start:174 stop:503 length:330 start_codon:yes stop_codon:yes gene_type:complete
MEKLIRALREELKKEIREEFIAEFEELKLQVQELEQNITGRNVSSLNKLTIDEISKEYKISKKTLYKLKKEFKLVPICKGGKSFIFDRAEVELCLRERIRGKPKFLDAA